MSDWIRTLQRDVPTLPGRVIDVVVWGASRPALFERSIMSFRARARFNGRLRYFLEDGAFDPVRAEASAALAQRLGFDGVNVERVGSYGWAMTNAMNRWVRAPLMFSLEDDWLCLRDLPLDDAFDVFVEHEHVNQIRFNRRENTPDQNGGAVSFARRQLSVGGRSLQFLGGAHWIFNPALWRMSYVRPRWKGAKDNIHLHANSTEGFLPSDLPPHTRPSPDWYADTLGALTWGGIGEPAFFDHIGGEQSIHAAQGRV